MDDVVRAPRQVAVARLGRDHVVRRRDQLVAAGPPGARRSGAPGTASRRPRRVTLAAAFGPRLRRVSTIAELAEDRVVEGVYAVARKRRLRTKSGSAYLALELVDPSGRIEGRVWNDVELLDARFGEGDAVRVLGRVERYRDRLQLDVRSIEAAPDEDPAGLRPGDAPRPGRARRLPRVPRRRDLARRAARDRRRDPRRRRDQAAAPGAAGRTGRTPRLRRAACSSTRSASRPSAASSASSIRGSAPTCSSPPPSCTTSAARSSSSPARGSGRPRRAGCSATCTSARG